MKKTLFILAAIATMVISCSKEVDAPEESNVPDIELGSDGFEIIGVIHNVNETAEDTKTEYTLDGSDILTSTTASFSWTKDDVIHLIVHKDNVFDKYRLWAQSTSPTSVFEDTDSAEKTPIGSIITGGWDHTGYALYPVTGTGALSYERGSSNTDVIVTLPSEYTLASFANQLSMAPLVGVRSGSTNVYDFYPGVGVLAFVISDVPTTATKVRVTSLDDDVPLAGKFHLQSSGIIAIDQKAGSNSVSRTITLPSRASKEDITLYIPLPVGDIAANGLRVELLDDSSYPIFKKKYGKALSIKQGNITTVSLSAPEWKKLGTGKFMDTHLWGKMGFGTNTFDEVGAVDVEIWQNTADHTQYRIPNPYGQASAYLAAEGLSQGEHDAYLEFVVADAGVSFTDHLTGYTVSSENVTIQYISDGTATKLIAGTVASPSVVQLAPRYKGPGSFMETKKNLNNKIQIVFPNSITNYAGSASIKNNKADLSDGLDYSKGASASNVVIQLSDAPIYSFFASDGTGPASKSTQTSGTNVAASYLGYGGSGDGYDQTNSGVKYLTWSTWVDNGGDKLCLIGCKKFYGITPAHRDAIIGQYIRDYMVGTSNSIANAADANGDNTLTLAVSTNPDKGNIMITEFAGYCYDVSEMTHSTLLNDFTGFTDGNPVYGVYGAESLDGNLGARFSDVGSQVFYKDKSSYSHYITPTDRDYIRLAFDSDGYSDGISHDLVVWEPNICNCYYSRSYVDLRFNSYVAYNSVNQAKMIPLTKEMISTNSSYGEGGSGDSGGSAALMDKKYNTYWHSNYGGSTTTVDYGIYIQIDLGESKTVNDFVLRFRTRDGVSHGLPSKYRIAVSKDGTAWSFVTDEISISAAGSKLYQRAVSAGDDYRYVRLCITEINHNNSTDDPQTLTNTTADGTRYTHMAEIQIWDQ